MEENKIPEEYTQKRFSAKENVFIGIVVIIIIMVIAYAIYVFGFKGKL